MTSITLAPVNIIHISYVTLTLFSFLLVSGKNQYKGLVLLLSAHFIQELFNLFEELRVINYLITPAIQLALGPLYYLFAKNLIYGNISIRKSLIHFLPAVIAVGFTTWWPTELVIAFVILVTYFFFTFRLLLRYHRVLRETVSYGENYSLHWLTRALIFIFIIEFIDFTRLNLQQILSEGILVKWYFLSALISLLFTAYLVLKAVRQPMLYEKVIELEKSMIDKHAEMQESDLPLAKSLFSSIDLHQHQTLAYRRPRYSLRELADELELTEQNVSWAINRGGEKSFSGFINELRIEDVKQSLAQNRNDKNLLDIALNAGFSSKSTFNAVFKKQTGMTPSQYAQK